MPVAKSYQSMPTIGEPYPVNNKMYIKIEYKGTSKQVRWYTDAEYYKMYPEEKKEETKEFAAHTQKQALGFHKGYITIFSGDTYPYLSWFQEKKECRYCRWWGWYVASNEEVPSDLPKDITALHLNWEQVGNQDGSLRSEDYVKSVVESMIYPSGDSEWQGNLGDRLELEVTITGNYEIEESGANLHVMEDREGNVYVWTTQAKNWPVGAKKKLRGTVKAFNTYKNVKQTILTRCIEVC